MNKDIADISIRVAEKICKLDPESKSFISGYMCGKMEERARWEKINNSNKSGTLFSLPCAERSDDSNESKT